MAAYERRYIPYDDQEDLREDAARTLAAGQAALELYPEVAYHFDQILPVYLPAHFVAKAHALWVDLLGEAITSWGRTPPTPEVSTPADRGTIELTFTSTDGGEDLKLTVAVHTSGRFTWGVMKGLRLVGGNTYLESLPAAELPSHFWVWFQRVVEASGRPVDS